jgi:diacylglycerol kinase (ATP)
MKHLLFIVNPQSGKGKIKNHLLPVVDIFVKGGYEVTVYPTQSKLDAYHKITKDAAQYQLVVVSGGDGTINEVVCGMMNLSPKKRPLLGYIPAGSTNDYAASLGIPKNMLRAAKSIMEGREFACDVGSFNHQYFNYVAAFGAFTDVAYETPQQNKNMLGHMAYILEGMKRLPNLQSYPMTVKYDGHVIEDEFIFGMVSNTTSVGGIKSSHKEDIQLNDGIFEVVLIKMPANLIEFQQTLAGIMRREWSGEQYYMLKTSEIEFFSESPVRWTLDGEFGGSYRKAEVCNLESAVTYLIHEK